MPAFNKFNITSKDLIQGAHQFQTHVYKIMLTNTAPTSANAVKADITEITAANGYSAGGTATTVTVSTSSGTAKAAGTAVVFTGSGGSFGPYRYAVCYNDTQTSPAKPLVGWWDYGSSLSTNDTETFTVTPDVTNGILTLA